MLAGMREWLKSLYQEVRPNAKWDIIKWLIVFWVAVMSFMLSLMWGFLSGLPQLILSTLIIFLIGLAFVIGGFVVQGRRIKRQLKALYAKEIEEATNRIKELEQEKTALEAHREENAKTIGEYKKEEGKDRKYIEQLENRINQYGSELVKHKWMHEIAAKQAGNIMDCLDVKVSFCFYTAEDHLPRVIFAVDIYNKSVFEITIEPIMKGHIEIGGHELRGGKKFIVMPDRILPLSHGSLTLEQRIMPEELEIVEKCLNDVLGAIFYFNKLHIKVAEGIQFPKVESNSLKLQERVSSKDSLDRAKELEKRAGIIEQLTHLLGMLFWAIHQYESGKALSKSELEYLDGVINQTLWNCLNDAQTVKNYYSVVKAIPTEVSGQQSWFQNNRLMLIELINQQRIPK